MSMIASDNGGSSIPKLEGGVYTAISKAIIDLGMQKSEKFGKTQRKFIMIWTLPEEEIEVNNEKLKRSMSKEYSFSLNEKSTLRKDLQAWRGKTFTEEELKAFDLLNILNIPCYLQIILEEKNGKEFNNIASIMALPKGVMVNNLPDEEIYYLDLMNKDTFCNWDKITSWIQDRIKKAENYESSGLKQYVEEYESLNNQSGNEEIKGELNTNDGLPF